jgi:hypothetical protein
VVVEEHNGLQLHLVLSAAYAVSGIGCDEETRRVWREGREGGEGAHTKT